MNFINTILIFLIKYYLLIPLITAGIYFLKQSKERRKEIFILALISFPIIYIVAQIGGYFYFDPRPFTLNGIAPLVPHVPDNGFPSDHTLLLSAIAMLFLYFNRKLGIFLWISAVLVGIARVYGGIHHPIDIIGSILISIVVTHIVYFFTKKHA